MTPPFPFLIDPYSWKLTPSKFRGAGEQIPAEVSKPLVGMWDTQRQLARLRVFHISTGTPLLDVCRQALKLFFDEILKGVTLHADISIHPLEFVVLLFKLLDPLKLTGFQAPILALPVVKRRCADAMLSAKICRGCILSPKAITIGIGNDVKNRLR